MTNQQEEFENATYIDASTFLSEKNFPTSINFCQVLLNIVPPLHNIHTTLESYPCFKVTIETRSVTTSLKQSILPTRKNLDNLKSITPLPVSNTTPEASYCQQSFNNLQANDTQNLIFSPPTYPSYIINKQYTAELKTKQSSILMTVKSTIHASLDRYQTNMETSTKDIM